MNEEEAIIIVGVEFGSIALYGIRSAQGWSFAREVVDQTPELIDEDWIREKSNTVDTWEAALKLLDQYPWFKSYPISIHPEFREQIWLAVHARLANAEIAEFALRRWRELCGHPRAP
jgi:hypothetical protein